MDEERPVASVTSATSPLRNPGFLLYFGGIIVSEAGVRGTLAINLYHVYALSGSTALVGLVGLFQVVALPVAGPLGGALADRFDRRRLIQLMQGLSLVVSATLAALTLLDVVALWHVYVSVLLNSIAITFDGPARVALIPGLVAREQLNKAFALTNPGREVAWLAGPALGGVLVAVGGPGLMYAVDAASYLALIVVLAVLRVQPAEAPVATQGLMRDVVEGVRFVTRRPIIWQLLSLDVITMTFGAWRVVLPELVEERWVVGPAGYGFLAATVPTGAVVGSAVVYAMIDRWRSGHVILVATAGYGLACIGLAQSPVFAAALLAGVVVGVTDALWSTVQQATIQLETPDAIRGRVSSLHLLAARGGPSLGTANVGMIAGAVGPVAALSLGGLVPVAAAAAVALFGRQVRDYQVPASPHDGAADS